MEIEENIKEQIINEEHLKLLGLFHYVSGGLTILFSCFFIIHLAMFTFISRNPDMFNDGSSRENPAELFGIFAAVFGIFIFIGILFGLCQILSGRFIRQNKNRIFSFCVAFPCLFMVPFGTVLGVCTLIVLSKESIKDMYLK